MIVVMPVCLAQPCGASRVPVFFFSIAMLVCDGDGMSDLLPEPAKKKPKAAARRLQQKPDPEEGRGYPMADLEVKRCQGCKKKLPLEEFHQSHSKCKFCFNAFRSIKGMANRQGEAEWFKGLTEGELCDLLKAYGKSHDQAMREKAKIKFSLTSYLSTVLHYAGLVMIARYLLHGTKQTSYLTTYAESFDTRSAIAEEVLSGATKVVGSTLMQSLTTETTTYSHLAPRERNDTWVSWR